MTVTIHQPEHFPYLGFFQKMKEADLFVILDNVTFRKNYFQNRNKILNTNKVEEWFTVPVPKNSTKELIKDVVVNENVANWREKIVKKLSLNFKEDFSELYSSSKLVEINLKSIEWCRKEMNIDVPMVTASSLGVHGSKSELLANICKEVNATKYISGPSGRGYLKLDYFEGIEVEYFSPSVPNYYSTLYNLRK